MITILEQHTTNLIKHLRIIGLTVNTTKTQAIPFNTKDEITLTIDGTEIGTKPTAKFLALTLTFDKHSTYREYIQNLSNEASKNISPVKPQLRRSILPTCTSFSGYHGEVEEIVKLECVGHVQKRVGTRCRRLKQGRKLEDGKGIAGTGRLTDKMIDTLQNYYGFAIHQNAGNLPGMIKAVKAILGHLSSTDQDPNHEFCDASWCGFLKDPNTYRHKNALPKCIIKLLEPIFNDLTSESLLQKCLHGKTQNNNECLNKLIWDRCSKEYFVERKTVEEAVYSAVAHFNDGPSSILKVLNKLGVSPGYYTGQKCTAKDVQRIKKSACRSTEVAKKQEKQKSYKERFPG
ncbi:forkhead box protein k1 [Plakobranchus ocellatus]|uniref:Forkhead box protein k1 n=1 Tax=Plakobranchus ocellatus TaxID=259542 RepID=A0AAV4ATG4_9GAST|nr:forkhead box protein k1 [Plakobranchus ocellatus]